MRELTFDKAINEALHIAMSKDPRVLCYGLGADDPKNIFGTTEGLQECFGVDRVFDTPTSENAMTGVGVGVSLAGYRPVMSHQRVDFFLLAMDQLINSAAKWHYMFGSQLSVPIVIRLIIGRGWGQGPTHSQNLQALFAHIPGLKVVMPTTAYDAKGLLLESIFDNNPVVFMEHRWLSKNKSYVPEGDYRVELGKAEIKRAGKDITLVAMSYMTVEALHAIKYLETVNISCELIDLRTVRPIDWDAIYTSVAKTKRLLVLDTGIMTGSIAGEIIARVSMTIFDSLIQAPARIGCPDNPEPTSYGLTKHYYPTAVDIVKQVASMLGKEINVEPLVSQRQGHHDVPGDWFVGPF